MSDDTLGPSLEAAAHDWLRHLGFEARQLLPLTGDVSLRRYLRVDLGECSAIVAVYPPEIRASCKTFLLTTRLFSEAGVRVPRVLASDCEHGLMLLEDVGSSTLYDLQEVEPRTLRRYFWRAVADIDRIQSISPSELQGINPPLNGDLLRRELEQTWLNLLEPLGIDGDPGFCRQLRDVLGALCRELDDEASVACHRDFMARNLIPVEPFPDLAVLDHQDLRVGPRFYDLASVLNDSLFPPADLEEEILRSVLGDRTEDRARYHRAAAQRTLKATGTYLMFAQRGDPRHRRLIPATLARSLHHLAQLPEASAVGEELARFLQPVLESDM